MPWLSCASFVKVLQVNGYKVNLTVAPESHRVCLLFVVFQFSCKFSFNSNYINYLLHRVLTPVNLSLSIIEALNITSYT